MMQNKLPISLSGLMMFSITIMTVVNGLKLTCLIVHLLKSSGFTVHVITVKASNSAVKKLICIILDAD